MRHFCVFWHSIRDMNLFGEMFQRAGREEKLLTSLLGILSFTFWCKWISFSHTFLDNEWRNIWEYGQNICDLFYQYAYLGTRYSMLFKQHRSLRESSYKLSKNLSLLPVGFAVAMSTSMTLRLLFNIRRAFDSTTLATSDAPSTLADNRTREDQCCDTIELTELTSHGNFAGSVA